MSLIQRTDQIQRLLNKFRIPAFFMQSLSPIVIPTTDLDGLLRQTKTKTEAQEVTGTGWKLFALVPNGRRWIIKYVLLIKDSGTFTISALGLLQGGVYGTIHQQAGSTYLSPNHNIDVIMEPGHYLTAYIDTFALKGNLRTDYLLEEEDAY